MSEAAPSVTFDLADFPLKQATAFVAKTYRTAWIRRCWSFGLFMTQISILMLFGEVGFDPAKSVPIFVLLIGLIGLIVASNANSKAYYAASHALALRGGMQTATLDEDGLTYSSRFSKGVLPWFAILDVVEWRDGLLFINSPYAHFPIPSSAFPTEVGRKVFLHLAKQRLASAQKDTP